MGEGGEKVIAKGYAKLIIPFQFDAAHRLMHHKGKCKNLHGHTYRGEIEFVGKINPETEMVQDFNDMKALVTAQIQPFDHAVILNNTDYELIKAVKDLGLKCFSCNGEPTVENLAERIYRWTVIDVAKMFSELDVKAVRLWEGENYVEVSD